jgi:hypothetical protein
MAATLRHIGLNGRPPSPAVTTRHRTILDAAVSAVSKEASADL